MKAQPVAEKIVAWARRECVTPEDEPRTYDANDAGRAEHFIDVHIDQVRYVPAWGKWLIWGGHHWQGDADGAIERLAVEHSRHKLKEAADVPNSAAREGAVREALAMGNAAKIESMLKLAKCDRRIVLRHDELDADPFLLGVQNGAIELRTGRFRAGKHDDLITKTAGTAYVEGATCPRWIKFLGEVLDGNAEVMAFLQKLAGYSLTGDTREQIFAFLYGSGKNGKSTFIETLQRLSGDYGQRAPQSLLTVSTNGREPHLETARLHGARFVVGSEVAEGSRLAENRVKDLTGGDTLTGRFHYADYFDFRPVLKLWLFGNHKPEIRGGDEGIWRRVRLIPFTVQFPEARQDQTLPLKLAAELPGILLWALEGVRRWLSEGLRPPAIVSEAVADYREEEDVLGDFLREETVPTRDASVARKDLYARYKTWAEGNGTRHPLTQKTFAKKIRERDVSESRNSRVRSWLNLRLRRLDECDE